MRALRNLAIFVVVLLVLGAVLDFGTRYVVENRIESAIKGAEGIQVGSVEAQVDSFPFLGRLALRGQVDHFNLRLERVVTAGSVPFATLELDVEDVVFARDRLLNAQVRVQSFGRATIAAEITERAATRAVGVPVSFTPDTATVVIGGRERSATADVAHGELTLSVDGLGALTIPIAKNDYFPCGVDVRVEQDKLVLSCTATELPPVLRQEIGGGSVA